MSKSNLDTEQGLLERVFKLKQHGTTARTELIAGITTFLTMVYIVFVKPADSRGCGYGCAGGVRDNLPDRRIWQHFYGLIG